MLTSLITLVNELINIDIVHFHKCSRTIGGRSSENDIFQAECYNHSLSLTSLVLFLTSANNICKQDGS